MTRGMRKIFHDAGLQGIVRFLGWGMVAILYKVTFSSHKAALVAKNEAICCW